MKFLSFTLPSFLTCTWSRVLNPDVAVTIISSLCAICSQQVGCHGSPSFSILCHSDTVIIWHFCPFLDVIRPHCSRSPSSSTTIYPSFHQQSLYPISSYYMSKILTFPFLIVFNNDLLVFILCKTSPLVLCSFHDILNILLYSHISKASNLSDVTLVSVHVSAPYKSVDQI